MFGLVLALLSSIGFATGIVFMRKGVHRSGESFSLIPISVFLGTVLFSLTLFVSGEAGGLTSISWLGVSSLAVAGVIHFVIARILMYTSMQLIGANRAAPILACSIPFGTVLGICFLGEPLTITFTLAFLLIAVGIIIISTTHSAESQKPSMPQGSLVKGMLVAFSAAVCIGGSAVLVKIGLEEAASSMQAVFVSHIAAAIVAGGLLLNPNNMAKLHRLDRNWLIPILVASVLTAVAQLLRYTALYYSPVSIVVPLVGTNVLFIYPLSFLINREIEAFGLRVIMGAVVTVAGIFLMFWVG